MINIINIKNLITAEEAREKVMGWHQEELQKCMSNLMEQINKTANSGRLSGKYKVYTDRPIEFYDTLQKALEALGFSVDRPSFPYEHNTDGWKWWIISW